MAGRRKSSRVADRLRLARLSKAVHDRGWGFGCAIAVPVRSTKFRSSTEMVIEGAVRRPHEERP